MTTYAKTVFSFDLGYTIDRTKHPHPLGKFDCDVRKQDAENPQARKWSYGGTAKTLKAAQNFARKLQNQLGCETRIVNSETGEILEGA